jgi:tetratricopeptide (TPR) repeat protein
MVVRRVLLTATVFACLVDLVGAEDQAERTAPSRRAFIEECRQEFQDSNHARVILVATEGLKDNPENQQLIFIRGQSLLVLEKFDEAIADFDRVIKLDTKNAECLKWRALARCSKKEWEAAADDYSQIIAIMPTDANNYLDRARILTRGGRLEKALEDVRSAMAFVQSCRAYVTLGMIRSKEGKEDEACKCFTKALELDPGDQDARIKRAEHYFNSKQYSSSVTDATEAIHRDAGSGRAYGLRGRSYYQLKDYGKSIADLAVAAELDKKHSKDYLSHLADAANLIGQTDLAISSFKRVLQIAPDHWYAHLWLARIYSSYPIDRFRDGKQAMVHAKRSCELAGWKDAASLEALASAYAENGQFEQALDTANKALRELEDDYASRARMAGIIELYYRRGVRFRQSVLGPNGWKAIEMKLFDSDEW